MDFISSLTQIASFGISIVQRLSIVANSDKDAEKIIPLANLVYHTSSVLDRVANLINGNEGKHPNVVKNLEEIRDNCRRDFQALLKALQSLRQVASSSNSGPLTSYLDGLDDEAQFNALFHSIETSSLLLKINLKELEDPDSQDDGTPVEAVRREEEQIVPQNPQQRDLNTGLNETSSSHGIQEYFGRRSNAARPVEHDPTPNYSPRPAGRTVGKASGTRKVTFAENPVVREPHDDIHAIYEGYLLEARSRAKAKAKSKAMFFQPYTLNLFPQDEDFLMSQLKPASRKQLAHDLLCRLPAPAREEVEYYLRKINEKISSPYQWTIIGIEEEFVRNTTRWRRLLSGSKKTRTDPPSWLVVLRGTERHPSCLPPEYPHEEMARLKLAKQAPDPELYDAEDSDSETSYRQHHERERRKRYEYGYENPRPRKRHYYRDYIDEDPSLALGPVIPPLPRPRPFSNQMRFWPRLGPSLPIEAQVQVAQAQVYRNLVRDAARDQTRDILRDAAWMRGRAQLMQQQQQLEQRRRLLGMSGMW